MSFTRTFHSAPKMSTPEGYRTAKEGLDAIIRIAVEHQDSYVIDLVQQIQDRLHSYEIQDDIGSNAFLYSSSARVQTGGDQ